MAHLFIISFIIVLEWLQNAGYKHRGETLRACKSGSGH